MGFSPKKLQLTQDGRFALFGTRRNEWQLWDIEKGSHLRSFAGHSGNIIDIAVSRDKKFVYTIANRELVKWELDWELDYREAKDWDEGAKYLLINFLTLHTPRLGSLPSGRNPTEEELTLFLTRRGKPSWTEDEFRQLLENFEYAGYGWLRPEGVRNKLEQLAAFWAEPPDYPG